MIKKHIASILCVVLLFSLAGCQPTPVSNTPPEDPQATVANSPASPVVDEGNKPVAIITMKDGGVIKVTLEPTVAPNTVNSFIALSQEGFYNGLIFHRVIAGFMIQGGDPTGTGMGGPGFQIKGEFASNGFDNALSHTRGVISMARSRAKDSAGSQFFIVHADATKLDGDYAAFGRVVEGIDVVDAIAAVKTDPSDKPVTPVVIDTIVIELNGYEPQAPEKMDK